MARKRKDSAPVPTNDQQQQQIQVSASASFSGPLPPPSILAQYNDVIENGAEQIFNMVKEQQAHRMRRENRAVDADISRARSGLRAGIGLLVLAAIMVGYLLYAEEIIAAVTVAGITITSIGGAFIYGTVSQRQERKERAEILAGRR